jgi:uncharacterized protein
MPSSLNAGLIFVPLVYFAASFYLYNWFIRMLRPSLLQRRMIRLGFLFLVVSYPVGKVLGRYDFNSFSHFLSLYSNIWMGATLFLSLSAAIVDTVFILWRRLRPAAALRIQSASLRRMLFSAVSVIVLLIAWYGVREARNIGVHYIDIPLRALPAEMDGLTVVQISDVHYGMLTENGRLGQIVERINGLDPDIVAITGDLVDENVSHMEKMAEPLAQLKSRLGVFAIAGNHEFYAGVDRAVGIMRQAGIRVLRNETAVLPGGLQIVGIDDPHGCKRVGVPPPDFNKIIAGVNPAQPSILLYHPPENFSRAAQGGIGLQLSGHTHGAQFLPIRPIARILYPQYRGLFCGGESYLYVNRGVGFGGPPMRLGSPPEITVFRLHRENMKNFDGAVLSKAHRLDLRPHS